MGDNASKDTLIPHTLGNEERRKSLNEEPAAHQVVGEVKAHQADDG